MGRRTIGPASSGQGGCIARGHGRHVYSDASAVGFWVKRALCQEAVRLGGLCFEGRMAFDLRLSGVRMGVAAMGQVCNYQLDIMKLGIKNCKFFI